MRHGAVQRRGTKAKRGFLVTPLAWFLVDEYSGLTGRKGTTVASVTSVLWFCVANHTGKEKVAHDDITAFHNGILQTFAGIPPASVSLRSTSS